MPRAGWLAIGGMVVGLAAPLVPPLPLAAALVGGAAVLALAAAFIVARRSMAVAAAAFGAGTVLLRVMLGLAFGPATIDHPPPTDERTWHATVLTIGSAGGAMQRAVLAATDDDDGPWRIYAWLPRFPIVAPSDELRFTAALQPAATGAGFGDYLAENGAVATARIDSVDVLPTTSMFGALEDVRRAGGDLLARALPAPQAGLAAGILIGLRDEVDPGLAADFTTSGLSHVVAISGWNIAVVGGVVAALMRGHSRRRRAVVVLLAISAYTLLAGASPSVMRAAIMGAVCLVARESGRRGGAATALGLAAWSMLLVDPSVAEDAGFQLSSVATAGLLAWGGAATPFLRQRLPERTPGWLIESLAVSLALQAATLPLILFHFGRLSLVSPVANLLVAPLVAPVMLAALIGLCVGAALAVGVPALITAPVSLALSMLIGTMVAIVHASASVPLASVVLPPPLDAFGAIVAALLVVAFGTARGRQFVRGIRGLLRSRRPVSERPHLIARSPRPVVSATRSRRDRAQSPPTARRFILATAGAGIALLVVAGSLEGGRPDGRLRMTVLDVGQGDSILLEGPRGGRILIDGGPDPDREAQVLDERIPAWDRRLDLVVLTHPHEDHAAGLALLLDRYHVGVVAEPGMLGPGPGAQALRATIARLRQRDIELAAGDSLTLDGAAIHVLWPRRGEVSLDPPDDGTGINNVSIVFDVRFGARRLLLMGDVEQEIDPQLIAAGIGAGGPVDVLKVAHHGSKTASTDPFLSAVDPHLAIISAGLGNPYGHPAPSTIARLQAHGARVFQTDLDGSVEVTTDGNDLDVSATGGRPAKTSTVPAGTGGTIATRPRPTSTTTTTATIAAADPSSSPVAAAANFFCAIPLPLLSADRVAASRAGPPRPARGRTAERPEIDDPGMLAALLARPGAPPSIAERTASGLPCYDRCDAHPVPTRSGRRAYRTPPIAPTPSALSCGGGDRRLPRLADRSARHRRGPPCGGERSAPPRPGQGAAVG